MVVVDVVVVVDVFVVVVVVVAVAVVVVAVVVVAVAVTVVVVWVVVEVAVVVLVHEVFKGFGACRVHTIPIAKMHAYRPANDVSTRVICNLPHLLQAGGITRAHAWTRSEGVCTPPLVLAQVLLGVLVASVHEGKERTGLAAAMPM